MDEDIWKDMVTNKMEDLCDICESRHKTNSAVKWCPECEEKLCDDCAGHHSVSKSSRNHFVVDIEQFKKIPASISEVQSFCELHDMKFTNLCPQHDKLCCPRCISGSGPHSKCTTLLIQDVIKSAKTSAILQSVDKGLKNLKSNLETIINHRQANLHQLHDQREQITKEINKLREVIVNHFNVIEQKILVELNRKTDENSSKLESEIAILEQRLEKAETLLKHTSDMKKYGSDLQTYIVSKTIEAEVAEETNSLQELVNNGSMKRFEVKLEEKKKFADIVENVSSFGDISVVVTPLSVVLTSENDNQAQIRLTSPDVSFDSIKVTLKSEFKVSEKKHQYTWMFS